jgi:hypothetical protein
MVIIPGLQSLTHGSHHRLVVMQHGIHDSKATEISGGHVGVYFDNILDMPHNNGWKWRHHTVTMPLLIDPSLAVMSARQRRHCYFSAALFFLPVLK